MGKQQAQTHYDDDHDHDHHHHDDHDDNNNDHNTHTSARKNMILLLPHLHMGKQQAHTHDDDGDIAFGLLRGHHSDSSATEFKNIPCAAASFSGQAHDRLG